MSAVSNTDMKITKFNGAIVNTNSLPYVHFYKIDFQSWFEKRAGLSPHYAF